MNATVIVDTCSYLRLARSINPLLKTPFCVDDYILGVIKQLQEEFDSNPRLISKFGEWVYQEEYVDNRSKCFKISKDGQAEINNAFFYIRETARDEKLSTGKTDILAVAHAHILEIPLITDDTDLLMLAELYEIKTLKSLEFLKFLLDCKAIDMKLIKAIAGYWQYLNDKPKSYQADYKKLFQEDFPGGKKKGKKIAEIKMI